ncbi:hypothetical protein V8C44DRAFT_340372 [Trichoderma aethiopicum]
MLLLLLLLLLLYCFCCYWAAVPYTALPTLPSVDLPEELASRRFAGQYLISAQRPRPSQCANHYKSKVSSLVGPTDTRRHKCPWGLDTRLDDASSLCARLSSWC